MGKVRERLLLPRVSRSFRKKKQDRGSNADGAWNCALSRFDNILLRPLEDNRNENETA
jgi:hypothetical protein